MPAKFTVIKNKAGSYRFTMSAPNGQVILTSQAYSTRSAALNGIASIRRNAVKASLNDTTRATVAKPVARSRARPRSRAASRRPVSSRRPSSRRPSSRRPTPG